MISSCWRLESCSSCESPSLPARGWCLSQGCDRCRSRCCYFHRHLLFRSPSVSFCVNFLFSLVGSGKKVKSGIKTQNVSFMIITQISSYGIKYLILANYIQEYREEKIYLFFERSFFHGKKNLFVLRLRPLNGQQMWRQIVFVDDGNWLINVDLYTIGWFREEGCKPFYTWISTALQELTSLNVDRGWWIMKPLNRPFQVVRRNTIVTAPPPYGERKDEYEPRFITSPVLHWPRKIFNLWSPSIQISLQSLT